ncbi:MAG: 16S rRNA (guanine(527)-N(7))-methyltransferase RsmG [Armatimonadetes bacterium]|nr:16S rRNA (guanine(527)-N(7))-methyltransferase RsmG [Armatimonadota bacterium]
MPPEGLLERGAAELGVALSEGQRRQCLRYLDLLLEWNARMNLTAVRDPREAVIKHFLDSLTALPLLPEMPSPRVADVGTGAGFPGLVLKIFRPDLRLTLLDSLKKRLGFLEAVAADLNMDGVETLHARAEDAGRDSAFRERFDLAVARAVAEMRVLGELCLPLVRVNGTFLAMKGPRGADEQESATDALRKLGGQFVETRPVTLPFLEESRLLVVVRKERPTPSRYPRRPADIQKKPL